MSNLIGKTPDDLQVQLKVRPDIIEGIQNAYVDARARGQSPHRYYLGASDIGHSCARHVFYVFHWAKVRELTGQNLRLFETGHREEERVVANLQSIGIQVSAAQSHGGQHHFTDSTGFFRVHLDGIIEPDGHYIKEKMLLEIKTMNTNNFDKMVEGGVRRTKPEYYRQMQMQLWAAQATGITRCLFFAVCKNDDRLHIEEVDLDLKEQEAMVGRAAGIIQGIAPPPVSTSPNSPPCQYGSKGQCAFKEICRENQLHLIERNCRTCDYAEAVDGGQWRCEVGHPFGTVCSDWVLGSKFQ